MNTKEKIGITVGIIIAVLFIVVIIPLSMIHNNAVSNQQQANEKIETMRTKLDAERILVDQHVFELNKEWIPTQQARDQVTSEIATFNAHRDAFNQLVNAYNAQYVAK